MEPAIPPPKAAMETTSHPKQDKARLWENATYWTEEYKKMEAEILKTKQFQDLPWNQLENPHSIRYQAKCIWIYLYLRELEGIIKIEWKYTPNMTNFFSIESFRVLDLDRFNDGMFPLPSGWKAGMRFRQKTLIHVWNAVGMEEEVQNGMEVYKGMRFNIKKRIMIKQQRVRAGEKRYIKNHLPPVVATKDTAPTLAPIEQTTAVQPPLPSPVVATNDTAPTLVPIEQTTAVQQPLPGPSKLLSTIASDQAAARDAVRRAQADFDAAFRDLQYAQIRANAKHAVLQAALSHLAGV